MSGGLGGGSNVPSQPTATAPTIAQQPQSLIVTAGQAATFNVAATGTAPLSYQWRKNGTDISGETSMSYTTPATTASDDGTKFTVVVTNAAGSVTSSEAILTVSSAPVAPSISAQPIAATAIVGQKATFGVTATGTAPLSYQWRKNGVDISGATSAEYTTPVATLSDNGASFTVLVTNPVSNIISSEALLTVNEAPTATQWVGFGSSTTGGAGKTAVHVTNLNDTGTGSFRAACGTDRIIVFDVAGTIALASDLVLTSVANVTIDGSTAPAPGITFTGHGISFRNSNNIIVTSIRHRGGYNAGAESGGCITFFPSCYNIVLDHLSLSGFQDEAIDFWNSNHDVTIQNCLVGAGMAGTNHNYECLIGHYPYNITVYHNVFANGEYRNPAVGYDDTGGTISPVLCAEVINNVTWKYTAYGITTYWGAKTNVTGNYLYTEVFPGATNRAVNTDALGQSYATDNYSKDGSTVNGTNSTPFDVPAHAQIKATSAADAANYVKTNAGCRVGGLDALDLTLIDDLNF